jgi:hypothetical protein
MSLNPLPNSSCDAAPLVNRVLNRAYLSIAKRPADSQKSVTAPSWLYLLRWFETKVIIKRRRGEPSSTLLWCNGDKKMMTTGAKQLFSAILAVLLVGGATPYQVRAQAAPTGQTGYSGQGVPLTADELQQLAAPIALYPDALVAQVLAAATFPDQVAAAEGWVQAHSNLTGSALMQAVDGQPWDPAVKALTQFPSVLGNMASNLTWTSSLGEA